MCVPFGELHGAGVTILALPVEVPVLDPDQRLDAAIGQAGVDLHLFAEPVRVRRDADQLDILRDDGGVGHGGELARREIEAARTDEQVGESLLRAIGEDQAERRAVGLGLAGGMVVDLDDEVGAFVHGVRDARGQRRRRGAGRPAAEPAGGRDARAAEAGIAGLGRFRVQLARFAAAVEIRTARDGRPSYCRDETRRS